MTKRFLLIVGLGVSFVAPAAFAADNGLLSYQICPASTGVNSECQLSAAMGDGATQCDKQKALDEMVKDNLENGYSASGAKI